MIKLLQEVLKVKEDLVLVINDLTIEIYIVKWKEKFKEPEIIIQAEGSLWIQSLNCD